MEAELLALAAAAEAQQRMQAGGVEEVEPAEVTDEVRSDELRDPLQLTGVRGTLTVAAGRSSR